MRLHECDQMMPLEAISEEDWLIFNVNRDNNVSIG